MNVEKALIATTHMPEGGLYFLERIAQTGELGAVIVQVPEGSVLKSFARKLLHIIRESSPKKISLYLSDFNIKNHYISLNYKRKLKKLQKNYGFKTIFTKNINNDESVISTLKNSKNLYQLVLGGKIIKKHVLDSANGTWINGHGGILPFYRGLYSEYWAIKNKDYKNIGCTIHVLTEKIDSGQIIKTSRIKYIPDETLENCILRNHANLLLTYIDTVTKLLSRVIEIRKDFSSNEKGSYYSAKLDINYNIIKKRKVAYL